MPRNVKIAIGGGVMLLAVLLFWWFAPRGGSQTVAIDRLTISEVKTGTFEDFIPLARARHAAAHRLYRFDRGRARRQGAGRGRRRCRRRPAARGAVQRRPSAIDARAPDRGRAADQQYAQPGARAVADPARQRTRDPRRRARADHRAPPVSNAKQPLAAKGFVSGKQFNDTRDNYQYQQRRLATLKRSQASDERLQSSQLDQQRASMQSMNAGLGIARNNLDALNLRAPVAGKLSGFSIQIGQSLQRGERIGQIDSPGRNKLQAGVDEFYLGRVQVNQTATVDWNGKTYPRARHQNLSAGPEQPVPGRPAIHRRRAARASSAARRSRRS